MCLLGPRRCRCPVAGNLPGTGIKPGLHVPSAGSSHKPEAHPPLRPKSPSAAWHARGLGSRRHPPARPWDSPARQAPPTPPTQREADAYQSPTTGPSNASHPKRSRRLSVPHDRPQQRLPPKEKQTLISQHLCKPKSLRKGGGRLRPPLGSSLQSGQGAAACGTQHTSS